MKHPVSFLLCMSLLSVPAVALADDAGLKGWMGRVRGEVLKIDGDVYTVEDDLGREVALHLDPNAERDADVHIGDEIIARTTHRGKVTYIKSIKKISSPTLAGGPLIEGKVVKIEGDSYLVKDISGRELSLRVDGTTSKDGNITIGDSVLAQINGSESAARAESLHKR